MKGLELSRSYYFEVVQPALRNALPELTGQYSAGLAGEGSDCLGLDDERSRDHDWGPGVCLWVEETMPQEQKTALAQVLASLPERYGGFPVRGQTRRTGVMTAAEFYLPLLGRRDAPETAEQWLQIPEPSLTSAVSGEVFEDCGGSFTDIRSRLQNYYPRDAWLYRMADAAALAAQTGQYNFARCLQRNDTVACGVIRSRFTESMTALIFLLNRRYRPFYKWAYTVLRELPVLGAESHAALSRLAAAEGAQAVREIESLSAAVIEQLHQEKLSGSGSDFLMDHVPELLKNIGDVRLRTKPVSLVF